MALLPIGIRTEVTVDPPALGQVVEPPSVFVTVVAHSVTGPIWEHDAIEVIVAVSKSVLV